MHPQGKVVQPSMTDLFVQMFTFPVNGFFYGMDWMMRAVRGTQGLSERGLDAMTRGTAALADRTRNLNITPTGIVERSTQEERRMDRDLSGDDLKVVRYRILFTKRDLEYPFEQQDDLVTYPTSGDSWGGLKIAEFIAKLQAGEVPRPPKWKDFGYPSKDAPDKGWKLPEEDKRYLKIFFEVVQRIEREKEEYDREKVRYLREISTKIG